MEEDAMGGGDAVEAGWGTRRLPLSDGQDHELHVNHEGRKDKPSPPTGCFLFFIRVIVADEEPGR
jgi:hypothetical protein